MFVVAAAAVSAAHVTEKKKKESRKIKKKKVRSGINIIAMKRRYEERQWLVNSLEREPAFPLAFSLLHCIITTELFRRIVFDYNV